MNSDITNFLLCSIWISFPHILFDIFCHAHIRDLIISIVVVSTLLLKELITGETLLKELTTEILLKELMIGEMYCSICLFIILKYILLIYNKDNTVMLSYLWPFFSSPQIESEPDVFEKFS